MKKRCSVKNATTLEQYISSGDGGDTEPSGMRQEAVTKQQAYQKLADEHFPQLRDSVDGVRKVKSLITLASLPLEVRGLFKQPDERTKQPTRTRTGQQISVTVTVTQTHRQRRQTTVAVRHGAVIHQNRH
ncbi:MAG: hypothetical protein J07HQX50_02329 [Haloquadratum sp. J07HQX50]|nr:MAG: hypothetical protein J07HQX50_02329 [Haloquadratum sp. J07HQX50]